MTQRRHILFLGPEDSPLLEWLRHTEVGVRSCQDRIDAAFIKSERIDLAVSYGYRHIIRQDVLDALPGRIFNLHISYLPWNRGADPNFWSFVEGTPKGVTIHIVDSGLDTGDIVAQREIHMDPSQETLRSSYERLQAEIQELFKSYWPQIRIGTCAASRQTGAGTLHRLADKREIFDSLPLGWDTPLLQLLECTTHLRTR